MYSSINPLTIQGQFLSLSTLDVKYRGVSGNGCALGPCHSLCFNPFKCVKIVISWPVCVEMVREASGLVAGRNVPVCDCWLAGHNGSEDPAPEHFQEDIVLEKNGTWNISEFKPNKNMSCFCLIKYSSLLKSQKCLWLQKITTGKIWTVFGTPT